MSIRFDFHPVTDLTVQRGAAPIGLLAELPAVELVAILYLRLWCEGGLLRDQVTQDFRLALNMDDAADALNGHDLLIRTVLHGARRPLMRHGLGCRCFGGDESAYANMLTAAAAGDREDSMLFAAHLMTGEAAYQAVFCAVRFGPALLQLARVRATAPTHTHPPHLTH